MLHHALLSAVALFVVTLNAESAQICREDIASTAPESRYQANGDGTVTDLSTGLIWKRCAEGQTGADCSTGIAQTFTWYQALQRAESAVFADSARWRLPNKDELASLVERRCISPSINTQIFPNTPSSVFWSSSPYAYSPDRAWHLNFHADEVYNADKNFQSYVRLVRERE